MWLQPLAKISERTKGQNVQSHQGRFYWDCVPHRSPQSIKKGASMKFENLQPSAILAGVKERRNYVKKICRCGFWLTEWSPVKIRARSLKFLRKKSFQQKHCQLGLKGAEYKPQDSTGSKQLIRLLCWKHVLSYKESWPRAPGVKQKAMEDYVQDLKPNRGTLAGFQNCHGPVTPFYLSPPPPPLNLKSL